MPQRRGLWTTFSILNIIVGLLAFAAAFSKPPTTHVYFIVSAIAIFSAGMALMKMYFYKESIRWYVKAPLIIVVILAVLAPIVGVALIFWLASLSMGAH
jgi:hypothetical protein